MRCLLLLVCIAARLNSQNCSLSPLTPGEPLRLQEGEPATDSDSFLPVRVALGPGDKVYVVDRTNRIRTIEPDGRLRTLAGNGKYGSSVQPGPALESPMPRIGQVVVSPAGVVHFSAADRIYRIENDRIVVVAGSGRPGFNGESGPALELNLGTINHFAFGPSGVLFIADGFLRIRRLDRDGMLRTFAGSSTPFVFGGPNGDGGPALRAALPSVRQVIPLRDGTTVWIQDSRSLRAVGADGNIRLLNPNLDPQARILLTPQGTPVLAAPGRANSMDANGGVMEGRLFSDFGGEPHAIGDNGLYATGSRNDLVTGLFRWAVDGTSTLIAASPRRPPTSGASSEPFGVWVEQTSSLIYGGTLDGVPGLIEVRSGQSPRLLTGSGSDTGDAEGKPLTALNLSGVIGFTSDESGRLVLLDVGRRRVLIVEAGGNVTVLKNASQQPVSFGIVSGDVSNFRGVAVDAAGNIYWMLPASPSPFGIRRASVSVWTRSTSAVTSYTVEGLDSILRLPNGFVAGIVGPTPTERSLRRLESTRVGEVEAGLEGIGIQSATVLGTTPYFVYNSRLFRGRPGAVEIFTEQLASPSRPDRPLGVLFVTGTSRDLIVRGDDDAFYRLENMDACARLPQPRVADGSFVSAAGYGYPDIASPWQLVTVFGSGLGPPEGRGMTLNGMERAASQPEPYPSLSLGVQDRNGVISSITLPVVFANDTQMTVQFPSAPPSFDLLFWSWNSLLLKYTRPIRMQTTSPGIFVQGAARDGAAAALNQDNTLNSPQRPASRGSVVQFFLTGLGALQPPLGGPGAFNSTSTLQTVVAPLAARIGGMTAVVEFAGAAPGYIGGLYQANVRIPAGVPTGAQAVEFESAGQSTSRFQRVTVNVE